MLLQVVHELVHVAEVSTAGAPELAIVAMLAHVRHQVNLVGEHVGAVRTLEHGDGGWVVGWG